MAVVFLRPRTRRVWGQEEGRFGLFYGHFSKLPCPGILWCCVVHLVLLAQAKILPSLAWRRCNSNFWAALRWTEQLLFQDQRSRTSRSIITSFQPQALRSWAGERKHTRGPNPDASSTMEKRLAPESHQVLPPAGIPPWKLHFPQRWSLYHFTSCVGKGYFFNICPILQAFFGSLFLYVCLHGVGDELCGHSVVNKLLGWVFFAFLC